VGAKAEQLDAVLFIHPWGFNGNYDLRPGQPRFGGNGNLGNVIGNPLETTIALSHLIQEGTLDLFPNLKIIAAHGGGFLPRYAGRGDPRAWQATEEEAERISQAALLRFDAAHPGGVETPDRGSWRQSGDDWHRR